QEEALAVSDRIIVMNKAVVAQDGTPRELYDAPANAFVADFIGEANILDCEVVAVQGDEATVRLDTLALKLPALGHQAGPAKLAVRPSRIEIGPAGAPQTIAGTLAKATYAGSHLELVVATALGNVFVLSRNVD
ncbi:TOBE domain-containing protein, partial [Mesorhizobium sp. M2A.F.Ca.ET.039.01.1.1]